MPTYQSAANILVAIRAETTAGVAATVTGASVIRINDSPGLELKRAIIQSAEKRDDAMKTMGRLGGKSVDGSYNGEVHVGGDVDLMLAAIMRTSWATTIAVGFATMTTVAIATGTLTAAAGDWVGAQALRVGQVFTITGTTVTADNSLRTVITALSSTAITVPAATFTTLAASATGTITVLRRLTTPTTPTEQTFSVEQYDQDTDLSELFLGCKVTGFKLSLKPGAMAQWSATFLGTDRTVLETGTSPYFTTPTATTGLGLVADDSAIRYNGAAVANFTGLDLDFQIAAKVEPVVGTLVPPVPFANDLTVSGTITGLRSDFANLTLFDAETEFEINVLLQDAAAAPKGCLNFHFPRCKISALAAPVGGGDGGKVETLGLMIGPKVAATGYDATIATISTSASA